MVPAVEPLVSSSSVDNISIETCRDDTDVEALRGFWSSSVGCRDSDIDIILAERRCSNEVIRPHVLTLRRAGRVETLLVGRIVRRRLSFEIGYMKIARPLVSIMTFPYGALRGNASSLDCELLIDEVAASLKKGEADLALFEHVKLDTALYSCVKKGGLIRDYFAPVRPHFKRELPATVEDFRSGLSSSERQRFRQIAKKLRVDFSGQVKVIGLGGSNDLDRTLQEVEQVAANSWQRKLGLGGFNTGHALHHLFSTEAEKGWLRIYLLYLGDKPVAFWIGAVYQDVFYSDFTGYDADYAKYSVGTYLLASILEDLCLQQVRAIDFGFSDEAYKRRFGNNLWHESSVHLFPATLKGISLSLMRAATAFVGNVTRALLTRTGLMQKVKKLWRARPIVRRGR